tara:strand:- start:100 stop:207 length:108 start_codon:yes stop_codon:yes gene_type:complete
VILNNNSYINYNWEKYFVESAVCFYAASSKFKNPE